MKTVRAQGLPARSSSSVLQTSWSAPAPTPMQTEAEVRGLLTSIAASWECIARRAFSDAAREPDRMGKKVIEMKAMNYSNCATQLRAALSSPAPSTSTKRAGRQKPPLQPASKPSPAPSSKSNHHASHVPPESLSHILVDVSGIGLTIADQLAARGIEVVRVRKQKGGTWVEVSEKSAAGSPPKKSR